MILELKRELPKKSGAVPSRLYIDGVFFGYGLENKGYMFPDGKYNLWARTSPSFGKNKVYIDVPGRSNIMFHGGNKAFDGDTDTKGCVLVAANRDGETIKGDISDKLFNTVDTAGRNGEAVGLVATTPAKRYITIVVIVAIGAGAYLLTRKHKK